MDYYTPRKAVVIAPSRVGSIMLCNALDSHPQISCERTEPLNPKTSVYLREGLTPEQTLRIVLSRPGFQWDMCKVSYRQLAKIISLQTLIDLGVEKIIHLWRENVLRVVVSAALNTSAWNGERDHPTHAWETPEISRIELDPAAVLSEARRYLVNVRARQAELATCGLPVLELTYEQIKPYPGSGVLREYECINEWLDVDYATLGGVMYTVPINPHPLSEIATNWAHVRAAIVGTEFEKWLEA
jgi:hypothetical protein